MHKLLYSVFCMLIILLVGCSTVPQRLSEMTKDELLTEFTENRRQIDKLTFDIFDGKFSAEIHADEDKLYSESHLNSTRFWPGSVQEGYREDQAFYQKKIADLDKTKKYYPMLLQQYTLIIRELEIYDLLNTKYGLKFRFIWK